MFGRVFCQTMVSALQIVITVLDMYHVLSKELTLTILGRRSEPMECTWERWLFETDPCRWIFLYWVSSWFFSMSPESSTFPLFSTFLLFHSHPPPTFPQELHWLTSPATVYEGCLFSYISYHMISLLCEIQKRKKISKWTNQTKQKQTQLTYRY